MSQLVVGSELGLDELVKHFIFYQNRSSSFLSDGGLYTSCMYIHHNYRLEEHEFLASGLCEQ